MPERFCKEKEHSRQLLTRSEPHQGAAFLKNPKLKLDISKAFDSVGWAYLLEVLMALGFGQAWRDWIYLSLASATSRVLLNGDAGRPFCHKRGLRQGDPLSPMLFILAIDPLQRILSKATLHGILSSIRSRITRCRISLYADDADIFVNPLKDEL
nr:secreted RxLR effector protein 78-like [Lolium perenne]